MQSIFERMDGDVLKILCIFGSLGITAIVLVLGILSISAWKTVRNREAELQFIAQMTEQGKSIEEIREVLGVFAKTDLARSMTSQGYSGDKIARVIQSFDSRPGNRLS